MPMIEFTPEELELVSSMLRLRLKEMDHEILHTDRHNFRQMLKERREVLDHVLRKLELTPVAG